MNQLTRVLLGQFILKSIQKVGFKPQFHHQSLKPQLLTQKLCYFDSNMKSRGFKTSDKDIPFAQYIRRSITTFPYCKLPKYNQRFSQQKQLSPSEYQRLVAFNSLFVIHEANKQKQLREMAEILLKQDFSKVVGSEGNNMLTGVEVFSMYYGGKVEGMVKEINEGELEEGKVTEYYQVMTNLVPTQEVKKLVEGIKEERVFKMNTHIQALHVKLLIRHNLPYIHAIDKLYHHLLTPTPFNLQSSKTLLTIPTYPTLLSQSLISQCMQTIITNVQNIEAFDHIMIIKHIYMNSQKECVAYIERVTEEIVGLHKQGRGEELHVPLMLKVIKYRSKLHLDNKMFLDIINSHPDKFNTVFRQKNVNKQIFLSLTTKQSTTQLSPQIRSQFGSYIKKVFEDYGKKDQIDQDQLVRNLKLVLKYGGEIKREEMERAMQVVVESLYDRIKHAASDQLKYYIFLVAYTFNYQQLLHTTTITQDTLETYHQKCLTTPTTENITRAINVQYQLMRKSSGFELRNNIWSYNYSSGVQLHPAVYSYLLFLLKKDRTQGAAAQKINVINQLKKNIYKNLSHGNFSMKIIYTLVDVLDELKYNDRYMFMDIQRGICKNLEKALFVGQKKKGVELPLPKDIMFLKNKLAKGNLCSSKFTEFLDLSQKNYNLIRDYAKDYVEKAKNWQKIRQNTRRNRQGDDKKFHKKNAQ